MRNPIGAFLMAGSALLLAACDFANEDGDFEGTPAGQFVALFDPSNSVIPFPNNILFSPSEDNPVPDGTLNIPVDDPSDLSDPQVALNALDGFSTIAPMSTTFSQAIDPDPGNLAASVRVFTATLNPAMSLAVVSIDGELVYGSDFFAAVASTDPEGKTLSIVPLRPLAPGSGYVVGIEKTLRAADGQTAETDTVYDATRIRESLLDANGNSKFVVFTDAQAQALEPLRALTNLQDDALNAFPTPDSGLADTLAIAWAFKTQSIGVVLAGTNGVRTLVNADGDVANAISPVSIGSTADLLPEPLPPTAGFADIYAGTLTVPYFLTAPSMANPTAPLTSVWKGPTGLDLTGVIPGTTNVAAKTGNQTIPLLISVPNSDDCPAAPACPQRPGVGADPWPVVIYQHGITTSRSTLLAVADALAALGFAAVAIDLPLHGLASDSALRTGTETALSGAMIPLPTERTFEVDYVTQDDDSDTILAQTPDGDPDSSGRHFLNLNSLLTSRDNLRQAVADLMTLYSQIDDMDYDANAGNNPDFDNGNTHFLGWSLGGVVGSVFLALEPAVAEAALAMPGGGIAKLLDGSASFGPEVAAGLAAAGINRGTADYEGFLGAAQTVVDVGDPLNYAARGAATPGGIGGTTENGTRGVMMFEIVGDGVTNLPDQTIPNNVGTFELGFADAPAGVVPSPTAGTDPLHGAMDLDPVTASELTAGGGTITTAMPPLQPLLRFTAGYHGSLVDPSLDPAANAAVTTVIQGALATFLANNGAAFNVDPLMSGVDFASVVE